MDRPGTNPKRLPGNLRSLYALIGAAMLTYATLLFGQSLPSVGQVMLLEIAVNGQPPTEPLAVFETPDSKFLVTAATLLVLNLRPPPGHQPVSIENEQYFCLDDFEGAHVSLDEATQVLQVHVPASAFLESTYNQHPNDALLMNSSAVGGFLNYDIYYLKDIRPELSALFETGLFFLDGTLTSRFIERDMDGARTSYRLDTLYQRDFPDQTATLVIGDSVSGSALWSNAVYFGGVQWHTNFGTRPDEQPIPLPAVSGSAAVPSSVDLYVDGVLRSRQNVDAGPFTLNNIPAVSGQGNLTLIVRDPLGRQEIFTQNYITSPTLLRSGTLYDSFEVGALHNNLGLDTESYGAAFASSTIRYGVTNTTTIEAHAEGSSALGAAGLGATTALAGLGTVSYGDALSYSGRREGALGYFQFDHQTVNYGASLRTQVTTSDFDQLGLIAGEQAPHATTQAQLSAALGATGGTLLFGVTRELNRGISSFASINAGLNQPLGRFGTLFAGIIRSTSPERQVSANVIWTVPLGDLQYFQAATNTVQHQTQSTVEFDQVPPAELGWGYRLKQAFGMSSGTDAGATYRSQIGEYTVAASNAGDVDAISAEARGGIAFLGGHIVATKYLDQSFALVTVPTSIPIDIYSNNVKVGSTNADGVGFIPNLVAYENNHVFLDGTGLPLQLSLDLSTHDVVPRTRTGVLLNFRVHEDNGATVILQRVDGTPVPVGTEVDVVEQALVAQVALRGEVFFANISFPAQLRVLDAGHVCTVSIPSPETHEPFPRLGPIPCQ